VSGVHEGRKLGFPTANLDLENMEKLIPAPGVYTVTVRFEGGEDEHLGMMNIGTRPTFGENSQTLEVHVLDYSGDLYHHTLSVSFHHRLREEHRFACVEELRSQLLSDAQEVRKFFTTK
jgi:riboflavin kinase/FMN adenylyltransferase